MLNTENQSRHSSRSQLLVIKKEAIASFSYIEDYRVCFRESITYDLYKLGSSFFQATMLNRHPHQPMTPSDKNNQTDAIKSS